MLAWHFVGDRLRDGRPVPADGVKLVHPGEPVLCTQGLHASERLIDALRYAPGLTICRVEMGGEIVKGGDKLVATERTILWRVDGRDIVPAFARWCALQVIDRWDAPEVVRRFLETGDQTIAARDAAEAAEAAERVAWAERTTREERSAAEAAAWAARAGRAVEAAAWEEAYAAAQAADEAAWAGGPSLAESNDRLTVMVMEAKGGE